MWSVDFLRQLRFQEIKLMANFNHVTLSFHWVRTHVFVMHKFIFKTYKELDRIQTTDILSVYTHRVMSELQYFNSVNYAIRQS